MNKSAVWRFFLIINKTSVSIEIAVLLEHWHVLYIFLLFDFLSLIRLLYSLYRTEHNESLFMFIRFCVASSAEHTVLYFAIYRSAIIWNPLPVHVNNSEHFVIMVSKWAIRSQRCVGCRKKISKRDDLSDFNKGSDVSLNYSLIVWSWHVVVITHKVRKKDNWWLVNSIHWRWSSGRR